MRVFVIIERAEDGYSAYAPDVGGCVSVGKTFEKICANIQEALELHYEGMIAEGMELPLLRNESEIVKEVSFTRGNILVSVPIDLPDHHVKAA